MFVPNKEVLFDGYIFVEIMGKITTLNPWIFVDYPKPFALLFFINGKKVELIFLFFLKCINESKFSPLHNICVH